MMTTRMIAGMDMTSSNMAELRTSPALLFSFNPALRWLRWHTRALPVLETKRDAPNLEETVEINDVAAGGTPAAKDQNLNHSTSIGHLFQCLEIHTFLGNQENKMIAITANTIGPN
uniref:Uncharacterized protein n=1 Tax=Oryza brachyantha TaxID=4533 RepID=J3LZM1_ORYBR